MQFPDAASEFILPTMGDIEFKGTKVNENVLEMDEFSDNSTSSFGPVDALPSATEVKKDILQQQKKMVNIITTHVGNALRALSFEGSLPISTMAKEDSKLERLPLAYYEDILPMLESRLNERGFKTKLDLIRVKADEKNDSSVEEAVHLVYQIDFLEYNEDVGKCNLEIGRGSRAGANDHNDHDHAVNEAHDSGDDVDDDGPGLTECPAIPPSIPLFPRFDRDGRFRGSSHSDTEFLVSNCTIM